jgi:excisionase family DNA binding protein
MPNRATTANDDGPWLLTAADVAERLQISREQVYRLVDRGELRSVPLGKQTRRFRPADVEAFISERAA